MTWISPQNASRNDYTSLPLRTGEVRRGMTGSIAAGWREVAPSTWGCEGDLLPVFSGNGEMPQEQG